MKNLLKFASILTIVFLFNSCKEENPEKLIPQTSNAQKSDFIVGNTIPSESTPSGLDVEIQSFTQIKKVISKAVLAVYSTESFSISTSEILLTNDGTKAYMKNTIILENGSAETFVIELFNNNNELSVRYSGNNTSNNGNLLGGSKCYSCKGACKCTVKIDLSEGSLWCDGGCPCVLKVVECP
jgi:hypothetical protein